MLHPRIPPARRRGRSVARVSATVVVAAASAAMAGGLNDTLFLHHFDVQNTNPVFAGKPGNADYAFGSPLIYSEQPPFSSAPGGQIVGSPVRFGPGALLRSAPGVGGRVMFDLENNFNLQRGTIDMWINSDQLSTSASFWGLWGTQVGSTSPGDIRMYIYNTGAGRTVGAYMIDDDGIPDRWEIERPIPVPNLTNNTWHHVAWEWDLSLGQTAIYWDGQALGTSATFGTVEYDGTLASQLVTRFHIGENQAGSAPFPGLIDEFRISDVRRYNGMSFTPPNAPYSLAVSSQWAVNASATWNAGTSWTGGIPDGPDTTATFGGVITQPRTVTVNTPVIAGSIVFDSAVAYTIAGPGTVTIQTTSGNGAISLNQGNHVITAPLHLASNTTLSGPGTLKIASLSIASGQALDMTDRALVVDYTGASPRPTLEALVATGFAGGGQNGPGIRTSAGTSTRRLGIAEAAETPFGGLFSGQTLDATSLILRYTVAGDADLSGTVDIGDFSRVAANFNAPGRWATGDFDYNGSVNIGDFSLLAASFNQALPRGTAVVPEPAGVAALLLGTAPLFRRRPNR